MAKEDLRFSVIQHENTTDCKSSLFILLSVKHEIRKKDVLSIIRIESRLLKLKPTFEVTIS